MKIQVEAVGMLRDQAPPGTIIENVQNVGEAIDQLGISHSGELITLINGKPAHWKSELRDGDTLSILPGISGGSGFTEEFTATSPRTYFRSP